MRTFNENNYTVYIDIDETLTYDEGATFIEEGLLFIKNNANKVNFYIWSQGGLNYVHKIVKLANIEEFIVGMLPKPDFIIDDLKFNQFSNEFYPNWEKLNNLIK